MSAWLEAKYIGLLSGQLKQFKKRNNVFNMRCPLCLDSATDSRKARGYIFNKTGKYIFYCHNCTASMGFQKLLKQVDPTLYNEFILERLKDSRSERQVDLEEFTGRMKPPEFIVNSALKKLTKVSRLDPDSRYKKYVESRKIPTHYHSKLFIAPNFMNWCNDILPNKFSKEAVNNDETRLVIPFINEKKEMHALQGRSFKPDAKPKYIGIVIDESVPFIYGLDTVDHSRTTYVVEGPIDSMFIPNCIATASSDLRGKVYSFEKDKLVLIPDNQPRNREIVKGIDKFLQQGYNTVIWPDSIQEKDINSMILSGYTSEQLVSIIRENTFSGIGGMLAFNHWRKT